MSQCLRSVTQDVHDQDARSYIRLTEAMNFGAGGRESPHGWDGFSSWHARLRDTCSGSPHTNRWLPADGGVVTTEHLSAEMARLVEEKAGCSSAHMHWLKGEMTDLESEIQLVASMSDEQRGELTRLERKYTPLSRPRPIRLLEIELGEHPSLPVYCRQFKSFTSKVSGSCAKVEVRTVHSNRTNAELTCVSCVFVPLREAGAAPYRLPRPRQGIPEKPAVLLE